MWEERWKEETGIDTDDLHYLCNHFCFLCSIARDFGILRGAEQRVILQQSGVPAQREGERERERDTMSQLELFIFRIKTGPTSHWVEAG